MIVGIALVLALIDPLQLLAESGQEITSSSKETSAKVRETGGDSNSSRDKRGEDDAMQGDDLLSGDLEEVEMEMELESLDELEMELEIEDLGSDIRIEAQGVRGWDDERKKEFLLSVKEHVAVRTGKDLEQFAQGVLLRDDNIDDLDISKEKVTMRYEMPASFLWLFDASLPVVAEVTSENDVEIGLPWYSFIYGKSFSKSDLQKDIEDSLTKDSVKVGSSVQTRAEVIRSVSSVLKTKHDTVKNSVSNIR
jgi:hypothetical protein